jgi:HK97 family phage portal protein
MIRKLINRFIQKSGVATPDKWLKGALGVEDSWAGIEITGEGALASSTVTACCRLLSESVASLPLHVYRRTASGKERATDHPLYKLLHTRPNKFQTSYAWRAHLVTSLLLHGNAYAYVERDPRGVIVALWPLDSSRVTIKAEGGELFYETRIGGEPRRYDYDEVLHVRGPSMDGIVGLSIIKLAKQGIGLDLAMAQHGSSYFKNNATPKAYLTSPNAISDKARFNLLEYFVQQFGGPKNAGKMPILDVGMEIKTVSFSPEDSQFLQSRQFSVQDVCRWFKVSPHLVGDPSRLAYASSEAEFNAYLVHSLSPHLVNIQSELNCTLLGDDAEYLAEFDFNGMARGSQVERYAAYEKGLGGPNPWLTVADVRAAENLPFLPGTDQIPQKRDPNAIAA